MNPLTNLYYNLRMRGEKMDLVSASSPERKIEKQFSEYLEYIAIHQKSLVFSVDSDGEYGRSLAGITIMRLIINTLKHREILDSDLKICFEHDQMFAELNTMCRTNSDAICLWLDKEIELNHKNKGSLTDFFLQLRPSQKIVGLGFAETQFIEGINLGFSIMNKDLDSGKIKLVVRYHKPFSDNEKNITCLGWIEIPFAYSVKIYARKFGEALLK